MPGDRFALAIRVGRENQPVGAFYGASDFIHSFCRIGVDGPGHGEIIIGQD